MARRAIQSASDAPLAVLYRDLEPGRGTRTTLRVPDTVAEAARQLAEEIGTSKNDAIMRLALVGARVVASARQVAEMRDARWEAITAEAAADVRLPDADEM
jgi:hypothetical protein